LAGALAGLGVAALPDFLIEPHILAGNLTPLLPQYPASDAGIYVIGAPGAFSSRKVRALIEILIEHFGDQET
jgi:DNA-binding transcriptional LysR family regulator